MSDRRGFAHWNGRRETCRDCRRRANGAKESMEFSASDRRWNSRRLTYKAREDLDTDSRLLILYSCVKGQESGIRNNGTSRATMMHALAHANETVTFIANPAWAQLPAGCTWAEVPGIAIDADDCVHVFARDPHRVLVFDRDGTFLWTWGEGQFARPHGITIGPDGAVWCTDDRDHTVRKFMPDGRLLLTLGTSGRPAETGATGNDFRTIRRSGPPFNYPTNVAFAPGGELYITDGYANARVHRFAADGRLLHSWGEPGSGTGEFRIPHGIGIDRNGT